VVTFFAVLFILICPLILFIVLIQDPKGGGLAGVLGGAGGGSAFGAKTADVVMKATVALGIVFFILALGLGLALKKPGTGARTTLSPEAAPQPGAVGTEEPGALTPPAGEEAPPAGEISPGASGTIGESAAGESGASDEGPESRGN